MTNILRTMMAAAGVPKGFSVGAADLDGSSMGYSRDGATMTGQTSGPLGIISMWVRWDAGDATLMWLFRSASFGIYLRKETDNKFKIDIRGSGSRYQFGSSTAYTASATWLHIMSSWNTNLGAGSKIGHLYVNNSEDFALVYDSSVAFDADYGGSYNWGMGTNVAAVTQSTNGAIAECYFNQAEYLDLSSSANRALFIDGDGKPVDLGDDGSTPTGTAPLVYSSIRGATVGDMGTNLGSSDNWVIHGTPVLASTSPSD